MLHRKSYLRSSGPKRPGLFQSTGCSPLLSRRGLSPSRWRNCAALVRVQAGDFSTSVVVDDASEIGRLQVGFNAMTADLAERERIREAFGTYVDRDVAEHIPQGAALQADEVGSR